MLEVISLLVKVGRACWEFHDATVVNLKSKRIQCDEIWSFVYSKEKNKPENDRHHEYHHFLLLLDGGVLAFDLDLREFLLEKHRHAHQKRQDVHRIAEKGDRERQIDAVRCRQVLDP